MKPSERMKEIYKEKKIIIDDYGAAINAIIRYLDEQHEKGTQNES